MMNRPLPISGLEAQVAAHGRNRAVDVQRQRMLRHARASVQHPLDDAQQVAVLAVEVEFVRQLQQAGGPRIARVDAVAEPGRRGRRVRQCFARMLRAASSYDCRPGRSARPSCRNRMHGLDVAAVVARRSPGCRRRRRLRSGAPVVATLRAASVEGGVTPWSSDDTSTAPNSLPIDGVGSSPRSSR